MVRRIGRWLFTLAAFASLLLCAGTVWLWPRSYRGHEGLTFNQVIPREGYSVLRMWAIGSSDGGLAVFWSDYDAKGNESYHGWHHNVSPGQHYPSLRLDIRTAEGESGYVIGGKRFQINRRSLPLGSRHIKFETLRVTMPHWAWASAFGVLPLAWVALTVRRVRHRRRAARHCCQSCGYDLRATPDPGGAVLPTCPECGTPRAGPAPKAGRPRWVVYAVWAGGLGLLIVGVMAWWRTSAGAPQVPGAARPPRAVTTRPVTTRPSPGRRGFARPIPTPPEPPPATALTREHLIREHVANLRHRDLVARSQAAHALRRMDAVDPVILEALVRAIDSGSFAAREGLTLAIERARERGVSERQVFDAADREPDPAARAYLRAGRRALATEP
ncbi:MAG TPA: hypothetical protein VEA69_02765 [Tepidisphaeraceae bacterium]|nr:hypothetical protein [Tepidisphaeraceae bacterium]